MKLNLLLVTVLGAWLAGTSMMTLASTLTENDITAAEWLQLPRYCPHTQGFPKGYQANKAKWEAVMGKNFQHMHHYCWALVRFHRAERASTPTDHKRYLRVDALDDFRYVTRSAESDFILLPEVFTWIGRTEVLLRKPVEADNAFAKARALKPDYWPAYTYWAEFLLANGRKAEALAVVKSGLQHAPEAKPLRELFRSLGGRPGDIPPPIVKKVDVPIPETPSPEQPGNPPVPAAEAQGQN